MSAYLEIPSSWPIARVVLFRLDPAADRPSLHALTLMGSSYPVPEALVARITAQERRFPLEVGYPDPQLADHARRFLGYRMTPQGAAEARVVAAATHGLAVSTRVEARSWGDGHAGVISFCRGLARALGGVIFDPVQATFRPVEHHEAEMDPDHPVPISEVTRSMSIPTAADRWKFRTHGMANVGLPDLVFDGVRAPEVPAAVALLHCARTELVRCLRRGPGSHTVRELRVGGPVGRVGLGPTVCSLTGEQVLRLFPVRTPTLSVGEALAEPGAPISAEA